MTFETKLRSEVRRQADGLALPDRTPARAAGRARQLRNRRRTGVATVAVAAALAAALPPVLDDGHEATEMGSAAGLPATGPLDLTWQRAEDGLSNVRTLTQGGDGTLYALSTAPGTSAAGMGPGPYARGLYRLEDDGTWSSLPLDGDPSYVEDLAAGGDGLYAISTAPTAGGGVEATLASSSDEGASWAPQDVELPAPPSDAVDWRQVTTLEVESTSSATVAVVATSWQPVMDELFPEIADDADLVVDETDTGYELRRMAAPTTEVPGDTTAGRPGSETPAAPSTTTTTAAPTPAPSNPGAPTTTTVPPTTGPPTTTTVPPTIGPPTTTTVPPTTGAPTTMTVPPPTGPPTTTTVPSATTEPPPPTTTTGPPSTQSDGTPPAPPASGSDLVRTVTWADLGVDGPEDLAPTHQVLQRDGDAWVALDGAGEAFTGLHGLELDAAAGGFVATGYTGEETASRARAFTSDDGAAWAPITAPSGGAVHGMGSALVALDLGAGGQVSTDAGATWADFEIAEAGIGSLAGCTWADAGPLGVAALCEAADGPALAVSSDLRTWTVTPLADVVGDEAAATLNGMAIHVGDDRVVVTANGSTPVPDGGQAPSATAIGVPTRS